MKQKVHVKFHSEAIFEELEARHLFSGEIEGILAENNEQQPTIYLDVTAESGILENSDSIATSADDSLRQVLVIIKTGVENDDEEIADDQTIRSSGHSKLAKHDHSMVIQLNALDTINLNLTDESNYFALGDQHDHQALLRNIDLMRKQTTSLMTLS